MNIKLAYLVSRYPAISHTFIQREIHALRSKGFFICVASINEPDIASDSLMPIDQEDLEQTFYVKRAGFFKALKSLVLSFVNHPLSFLHGLWFALCIGKLDLKKIVYSLFYFTEAALIGRWMEKNQVHHLHVHFANPASTVALIASKIYPITFSLTVHGPDEFYDVTLNLLPEKIENARFICCVSYYTCSQLMRLSSVAMWNKFEITPLGVNPFIYAPRPPFEEQNDFTILSVGRLSPNKGQAILIAAFSRLAKENPSATLEIIGEGPCRHALEQLIDTFELHGRVILRGALNQNQLLEVYRHADLFALASFAEGLPVVLMEAMAMEIPCVASAVNGIPELIKHGINGMLVAPSNAMELAEVLLLLIKDPALRNRLGRTGRQTILEKYNLDPNIEHLSHILKERLL
jgi:colanic acid/amylovoran biosynthesis glycosyltransferase